jgi:hypothetical protein
MTGREPISKMTPKANEDEASMRLATQIAPRIDELIKRMQTLDHVVMPGSSLDADDNTQGRTRSRMLLGM